MPQVDPRRNMDYRTPRGPTQTTEHTLYKTIELKEFKSNIHIKYFDKSRILNTSVKIIYYIISKVIET